MKPGSKKAIGAFKKLADNFTNGFFDSMLRDHKIGTAIGKGVSAAWTGGGAGTRLAMAGAGAYAGLKGYNALQGISRDFGESPVGTAVMIGGIGAGISFGATQLGKTAFRRGIMRSGKTGLTEGAVEKLMGTSKGRDALVGRGARILYGDPASATKASYAKGKVAMNAVLDNMGMSFRGHALRGATIAGGLGGLAVANNMYRSS